MHGSAPRLKAAPGLSTRKAVSIAESTLINLGPTGSLSITNETSASAALTSLALYEAQQPTVLSQVVSAMAVDAPPSNSEYSQFFSAGARSHPGQIECGCNIRSPFESFELGMGGPG